MDEQAFVAAFESVDRSLSPTDFFDALDEVLETPLSGLQLMGYLSYVLPDVSISARSTAAATRFVAMDPYSFDEALAPWFGPSELTERTFISRGKVSTYNFSDRTFEILTYVPKYSQLVLRSPADGKGSHRLDLVFRPTAFICLPTNLDGITVGAADPAQAEEIELNLPEAQRGTMNVYEVTPNAGKAGFVIASQFGSQSRRDPEGDETQILLD